MDFVEHLVCFELTIVILLKYLIYVCNKYCHDIKIYTYTIYVIKKSYNKNNKAQVSSTRLYLTQGITMVTSYAKLVSNLPPSARQEGVLLQLSGRQIIQQT